MSYMHSEFNLGTKKIILKKHLMQFNKPKKYILREIVFLMIKIKKHFMKKVKK